MSQSRPHKPKIGIVSFAHYHASFWAEALNQDAGASLAGIWDLDAARGEEAAKHQTRFHPPLTDMLDACDAVGIRSETVSHAPHIKLAAEAGRHALCEKPIAESVATALDVREKIKQMKVLYMQSFPKCFDPISHELKSLVDSRVLGRISLARVRHGHYHGLDPEFRKQWYVDPDQSGGGALLDEGVHAADLVKP